MATSGTAIGVVILLATLMIGALIFTQVGEQVDQQINESANPDAQAAFDNIEDTGWNSLQMLAISAFVAAAVTILAILMVLGRGGSI